MTSGCPRTTCGVPCAMSRPCAIAVTWSHSVNTSGTLCSISRMDMASSHNRRISAFSDSTSAAVSPAAGSSSSSSFGPDSSARASSIWRRCQADRSAMRARRDPA